MRCSSYLKGENIATDIVVMICGLEFQCTWMARCYVTSVHFERVAIMRGATNESKISWQKGKANLIQQIIRLSESCSFQIILPFASHLLFSRYFTSNSHLYPVPTYISQDSSQHITMFSFSLDLNIIRLSNLILTSFLSSFPPRNGKIGQVLAIATIFIL
jgi:hypothetical protein